LADVKISGLPASTTPLAGTEVLPIVQGGQTRQVSVANLTAGRAVNATDLTLTGVATVPAGSVGTPSITTTGDTNTGIFFPAADTVAIATNGAERMRVSSVGRVGIGTNNPSSSLTVYIAGSTTTTSIALDTDLAPNLTIRRIALTSAGGVPDATVNFAFVDRTFSNASYLAFNTTLDNSNRNLERMRIFNTGGVSIGNTTDPGATNLSVTGAISAATVNTARYYTALGNTGSIANATATTIYTITGRCVVTVGAYLFAGAGTPASYAATATVIYDGVAGRITSNNGTLLSLTLSGADIQVTQSSGVTQATGIRWSVLVQTIS
jgi:hypothetical protein